MQISKIFVINNQLNIEINRIEGIKTVEETILKVNAGRLKPKDYMK